VIAVDASSAPLPAFDVAVGTEAVLHRVRDVGGADIRLVAFLELDRELLAARYRAAEQALWLLVRAARLLGRRSSGGTLLLQTRLPADPVVAAASEGDPGPLLADEWTRREALAYPPFGGLAEIAGAGPAVVAACDALRKPVRVLGPDRDRALARAASTSELCDAIASVDLAPARALGRLRVDVDPLRV
jgi:primosomal protein N' (replication factor Y)